MVKVIILVVADQTANTFQLQVTSLKCTLKDHIEFLVIQLISTTRWSINAKNCKKSSFICLWV